MSGHGIDAHILGEIRQVVRECVRELAGEGDGRPTGAARLAGAGVGSPAAQPGPVSETVTIRSDADLQAFTLRLCALLEDPAQRAAIRQGRRRFVLGLHASGGGAPSHPSSATGRRPRRTETAHVPDGVLTERGVVDLAKSAGRVILGPAVRVTPLAHDKARDLGLVIEREA
jgi:hypothetical protein